ncbi:MAG: hypothetical protein L6R48_09135 [Planctomycetes bacterium]|nr:hypothetical protein [Planctomycetota bacterium]
MNDIDDRLARIALTRDSGLLNSLAYYYMDGCPGDFDYRAEEHTLVLVNSERRSADLLRFRDEVPLFRFGPMREWKQSDERYKRYARNAMVCGKLSTGCGISALRFSMPWLMQHAAQLHARHTHPSTVHQFQTERIAQNGDTKVKLIQCLDARGRPIEMTYRKLTVLLLWTEFIIMRFEHDEAFAAQNGFVFDGMAVFADLISGDGATTGDYSAQVVRAALNDAYRNRITLRNYAEGDRIAGELAADNLAGIIGRMSAKQLRRLRVKPGNALLEAFTPRADFTFQKIAPSS